VAVRSVKSGDLAGGSIASLRQTCIPLPGEKLHFSALFERGANSEIRGVPIGDITYHLTSQQTGFPDPALICGFGFCEELMPRLPLRPEVAPSLELLLNRKHEVAFALLPQGALNQKAKQLYSLQKQLFDQDRSYFITKHRAIAERILRLFEADEADLRRIKSYFQKLLQTAPDYDELSSLYRQLNEATIEAVATLENSLLSYDAMMDKPSLAVVEESLIAGLNEEILPKIGDDTLLNTLQRTLVKPTARFILQSASEKHHFPPPTLTQAELRLQSAIFYQQIHFFQQLEDPQTTLDTAEILTASHSYFDTLLALLKGEKASTTGELALHLVEEVEGYYNSRYLESAV
jgi:hypothetical protein